MRPHRIAVVALLMLLLILAAPSVASASQPLSANGKIVTTSQKVVDTRTVDGVTFRALVATYDLTGTFDGDLTFTWKCIVRSTGPGWCKGRGTFIGTVSGRSGTVDLHDVISVDPSTGAFKGRFVLLSGTCHLTGIHGSGTLQGDSAAGGTYSGKVVFAHRPAPLGGPR